MSAIPEIRKKVPTDDVTRMMLTRKFQKDQKQTKQDQRVPIFFNVVKNEITVRIPIQSLPFLLL